MTSEHDISVAELSRQVRDVVARLQSLVDRLDNVYVTKEMFNLFKILIDQEVKNLKEKVENLDKEKSEKNTEAALAQRVADLEDNQKWITRLIVSLVVIAVVGLVIVTGGSK